MDRIVNEGKNITNYMLLKESQGISISFFSGKDIITCIMPPSLCPLNGLWQ